MSKVPWDIQFHAAFEAWTASLVQADAEALLAALRVLRDEGPALGRPLVDSVVGSRHSNMKELRPGSTGRTEVRVLFAFDKLRRAIFLVGGATRATTGAAGTPTTLRWQMTGSTITKRS